MRGKRPAPVVAPTWATSEEAMAAGEAAFNAGDDERCLAAMNFVLARDKPDPRAWYWMGRVHGRKARYTAARDALEKFVNLMPVGRESDIASKLLRDYELLDKTRFKVISRPPGATFALEEARVDEQGRAVRGASVTAPAELAAAPGEHKLVVSLTGYEPQTVTTKVDLGETTEVSVTLKPLGCDVTARVLVANVGGTVAVDDAGAAPMPGPFRVRPGTHSVEMVAPGGAPARQQLQCRKDEPLQVALTVDTVDHGRIAVTVPPGGKALVDGKELALTDHRGVIDVKPGDHLIDMEVEGMVPWHTAVLVRAGETLEVRPTPEAGGGATGVEVTAQPADARITIDGMPADSGQMMRTDSGSRRIEVRARGYHPVVRTINVVTGERAHVEVHLVQRGRFLLFLGLAAIPIAAGAEGLAILGHVNAGGELAGSAPYNRWHALEVSGHVVAGAAALVAVGSFAGWVVLSRQGDDDGGAPRVSVMPTLGGAGIAVSGTFQ